MIGNKLDMTKQETGRWMVEITLLSHTAAAADIDLTLDKLGMRPCMTIEEYGRTFHEINEEEYGMPAWQGHVEIEVNTGTQGEDRLWWKQRSPIWMGGGEASEAKIPHLIIRLNGYPVLGTHPRSMHKYLVEYEQPAGADLLFCLTREMELNHHFVRRFGRRWKGGSCPIYV